MNRPITELSPDLTAGVQAETEALTAMTTEFREFEEAHSAEQYWRTGISWAPYQYESLLANLPAGLKILDIGVGFGQSSVYLATLGHKVVAVEPTMALCRLIRDAAARHDLDIEVVQGVAEHLVRLGRDDFDVVLFNASLHHCDDPVLALGVARDCLRPDGVLYLVNENMLKPWQSKAGFQRRLAQDPLGMGHYGGNEHAYHNWEYASMLAGHFGSVKLIMPRAGSAVDDLRLLLSRHVGGTPIYSSSCGVLARFVFYIARSRIRGWKGLYLGLGRISVVPVHFGAKAPRR